MKQRPTILQQMCRLWVLLLTSLGCLQVEAEEGNLTFFGWSDQHVQTSGDASHLIPAIEAFNQLPGTAFPEEIGGTVDRPAFVLGCGDITEWPTRAARDAYDRLIRQRLRWPAYDVLGNHDEGGAVASKTMTDWLVERHGALSYTFEAGGIRFLAVFSKYDETLNNPAQPLAEEALQWLSGELVKLPPAQPVVVATHLCFDAITNRDKLVDALSGARVLMVLGGHYHKAKVDHHRGVDFVQLPSPAPKNSADEVTVIRITPKRLVAIPYNYKQRRWAESPRKILVRSLER